MNLTAMASKTILKKQKKKKNPKRVKRKLKLTQKRANLFINHQKRITKVKRKNLPVLKNIHKKARISSFVKIKSKIQILMIPYRLKIRMRMMVMGKVNNNQIKHHGQEIFMFLERKSLIISKWNLWCFLTVLSSKMDLFSKANSGRNWKRSIPEE